MKQQQCVKVYRIGNGEGAIRLPEYERLLNEMTTKGYIIQSVSLIAGGHAGTECIITVVFEERFVENGTKNKNVQ